MKVMIQKSCSVYISIILMYSRKDSKEIPFLPALFYSCYVLDIQNAFYTLAPTSIISSAQSSDVLVAARDSACSLLLSAQSSSLPVSIPLWV